MKNIKYVGSKPEKTDNVAHTGVIWKGNGDVQEVPDKAVPMLLAHPTIWELDAGGPRFLVSIGVGDQAIPYNLDAMNDAELKALVSKHDIKGVDRKKRGDDLRADIAMAVEPKA